MKMMNRIKHCGSMGIAWLFLLLCASVSLHGQFVPAVTADGVASAGPVVGVANTGNDVDECSFCPSSRMLVMTWDGQAPMLAWDHNGTAQSLPLLGNSYYPSQLPVDPDIVVGNNGANLVVAYELADRIFIEAWQWNSGSGLFQALSAAPILVYGSSVSKTANICIDPLNNIIVSWQSDVGGKEAVFARCGDVFGALSANVVSLSQADFNSADYECNAADVSVYHHALYGHVVHFCYRVVNSTTLAEGLVHKREDFSVLQAGSANSSAATFVYTPPAGDKLNEPRISSIWNYGNASSPSYFEIVFQHIDVSANKYYIKGYNGFSGLSTNLNTAHSLEECYNARPVVSFYQDWIHAAWEYDDDFPGCGKFNLNTPPLPSATSAEVLVNRFGGFNGIPYAPPYYLQNINVSGFQGVPSIAGRKWISNPMLFLLHFDKQQNQIVYKLSNFSPIAAVKQGEQTLVETALHGAAPGELTVYPQPATGDFTIRSATASIRSLRLRDMMGNVIADLARSNLSAGRELQIDGSALPAGSYILEAEIGGLTRRRLISIVH